MSVTAKTHLVTAGLLALALLCYALGAVLPGSLLLLVGGVFELAFWFRVIRRPGKRSAPQQADE